MPDRILWFLSGEWMLGRHRANGGTVIFFRAVWVTVLLYAVALALRWWGFGNWPLRFVPGGMGISLDMQVVRQSIAETLPWLGAIAGGVYVAFYARFSAQWSYLAGVYNQLYATQAQLIAGENPNLNEKIQYWKVSFVEDADDLHLATKPMFAPLVAVILNDETLGRIFEQTAVNGTERRANLRLAVTKAMGPNPPAVAQTPPPPPPPGH